MRIFSNQVPYVAPTSEATEPSGQIDTESNGLIDNELNVDARSATTSSSPTQADPSSGSPPHADRAILGYLSGPSDQYFSDTTGYASLTLEALQQLLENICEASEPVHPYVAVPSVIEGLHEVAVCLAAQGISGMDLHRGTTGTKDIQHVLNVCLMLTSMRSVRLAKAEVHNAARTAHTEAAPSPQPVPTSATSSSMEAVIQMLIQAQTQQVQHQQQMAERQERLDAERIESERRRAEAEEERTAMLLSRLVPEEDYAAKALKAAADEALKAEKTMSALRRELDRVEMKAHDTTFLEQTSSLAAPMARQASHIQQVQHLLLQKHEGFAALFDLEYNEYQAVIYVDERLKLFDATYAQCLCQSLKGTSPEVKTLFARLQHENPKALLRGCVLAEEIKAHHKPRIAIEYEAQEEAFKNTQYFKAGMTKAEVTVAARLCLSDYEVSYPNCTHARRQTEMLKKMPDEFATKRQYLRDQISDAEIMKVGSLKYSDEQLIALIASEVGTARVSHARVLRAEAGTVTEDTECSSAFCDEIDPNEVAYAVRMADESPRNCPQCGKLTPAAHPHGARMCKERCPKCKSRFCTGAIQFPAPGVCVNSLPVLPPRDKIINGAQRVIPPSVYSILENEHREFKSTGKLTPVHTNTRGPPPSRTARGAPRAQNPSRAFLAAVAEAQTAQDYAFLDNDTEPPDEGGVHFECGQQVSGPGRELTLGACDAAPPRAPVEIEFMFDTGANVSLMKDDLEGLSSSTRHAPFDIGGHAQGSSIKGSTRHTCDAKIGGVTSSVELVSSADASGNLLSVSGFCKTTGAKLVFDEHKVTIIYPDGTRALGRAVNGLYPFRMHISPPKSPAGPAVAASAHDVEYLRASMAIDRLHSSSGDSDGGSVACTATASCLTASERALRDTGVDSDGEELPSLVPGDTDSDSNDEGNFGGQRAPRDSAWRQRTPEERSALAASSKRAAPATHDRHQRARVGSPAHLWSARLHVSLDALKTLEGAFDGLDIGQITDGDREMIASDLHRVPANMRRAAAGPSNTADRERLEPYEELVLDGFGAAPVPSAITGKAYMMHAWCRKLGAGFATDTKTHTTDDWIAWLRVVIADVAALGRHTKVLRVDAGSDLANDGFRQRAASELGCTVRVAPGGWHEGVAMAESMNDLVSRMADAMVRRAQLGPSYFIPARLYAVVLISMRCVRGMIITRSEAADGVRPDAYKLTPFLFGTTVAELEDKGARGPPGSESKPRAPIGILVGISKGAYSVRKNHNAETVLRHAVQPLNELALLRNSVPSGVALVDEAAQTPALADFPPIVIPPPPPPTPVVNEQREAVGARLEFHFEVGPERTPRWFGCTVTGHRTTSSGVTHHAVEWDADEHWDPSWRQQDWQWVNLKNDTPMWRTGRPRVPAPPVPPAPAVGSRRSPRLVARLASMRDDLMTFGFDQEYVDWTMGDDLRVRHREVSPCDERRSCQVNKASQNIVDVVTDAGVVQMSPPSTAKQLLSAVDSQEWLIAERKGLQAILTQRGNALVERSAAGTEDVAKCVTTRKYKIDPSTHRLSESNGRKSRHALDGAYLEVLRKRRGLPPRAPALADAIDEMTLNMLLADTAGRRRTLTKGDVGNAYAKAERRRPTGYMEIPTSLRGEEDMCDERGEPLIIELHTPIWGEVEAGFEWHDEFHCDLVNWGWTPCEGVPALYHHGDARLGTIVDDFLVSEDSAGGEIAERTLALMRAKYGDVTSELHPTSFYGCKLEYGADGSITISLPQKIVEAVREHVPALLDGKTPKQLGLLTGIKLQQALDSLELGPPRKACADTTSTQSVTGSLKFCERVHTRFKLSVHRLSCVQAAPTDPAAAKLAAISVLAVAYDHRHEGRTWRPHTASAPRLLSGNIHVNIFDMADGAPSSLEAHGDFSNGPRQIIGELVTFNGAVVAASTKTLKSVATSTMQGELGATSRVMHLADYGRTVAQALGVPQLDPTFIGTDNEAHLLVATHTGSAKTARHLLCRYHEIVQAVQRGTFVLGHVPDAQQPADHLTKWVSKDKLEQSVAYANGWRASIAGVIEMASLAALRRRCLRVLILYAGAEHDESLAAHLRGRGHVVVAYEYIVDPIRQNLERPDVQDEVIEDLGARHYDAVFTETPCSSFSVAQEPAIRTLTEPEGTAASWEHWGQYLERGNRHARFTARVCATASAAKIPWFVENPPARSHGSAYWREKAHHATLFDQPCIRALVAAWPTAHVNFAQCEFGSPFQKLTTVLASGGAAASLVLLRRQCTHTSHTSTALGDDSARAAVYPPALNSAFADVIERACFGQGE